MTPNKARLLANRDIDFTAGETRMKYITDVPGQQAVYLLKLQEATAYGAARAGDADAAVPPHIAAEAAATGVAPAVVAANIVAIATVWNEELSPAIEGARLGGKAAVAAATGGDVDEILAAIEAARTAAIDALVAL